MNPTITVGRKTQTDSVETHAAMCLRQAGIMENPYFRNLENGTMSRKAFAHSQNQFYFAVAFYSRPMGILMTRMPDLLDRTDILRNIVDEHGGLYAARSHQYTFQKFLQSLGEKVRPATTMHPAVHSFNSVLTGVCCFDELEVGIACLGIIELAFAEISSRIGRAAVERAFVREQDLVHYTVHRDLDIKHADHFFSILTDAWHDPTRRVGVERGLDLGAHIFDRLYSELLVIGEGKN